MKEPLVGVSLDKGIFLNDTARGIYNGLGGQCFLTRLSAFYHSCKEVRMALDQQGMVRRRFGGDKKIIVAKTLVLGSEERQEDILMLSNNGEPYDKDVVAGIMGCAAGSLTTQGIDLRTVTGRMSGECSVLIGGSYLDKMKNVIFSNKLCDDLAKANSVVVYALGRRFFFCAAGRDFLDIYFRLVKHAIKKEA